MDGDIKRVFCEEKGYEANFLYGSSDEERMNLAYESLESQVDYLLILSYGDSNYDDLLNRAARSNIKVIFFDYEIDGGSYTACVVPDMEYQGKQAVQWLADQNLSHYDIVHLMGTSGSDAQRYRSDPLQNKVKENADWKFISHENADWSFDSAKRIVENVINSGKSFNVIYAESDDMAAGAAQALDDYGISHGADGNVIIVSFDCC